MTLTEMDFFPSNFMLPTTSHETDHHQQHHLYQQPPTHSLPQILPSCSSQDFHGVASLLGKRSMSFSGVEICEETHKYGEDDLSDDDSQIGEKKRRLNMEQVQTLEKNFELGNKLEPERKLHLARELGLQPRQIAIWFQNRRARWKNKQLEKDYEILKRQFDTVKAENDSLQAHSQKLLAEIMALKNRESTERPINLNIKETEGSCRSDENRSDVKLEISRTIPTTTTTNDEDSPLLSSKPSLFPPSSIRPATSGMAQLFQTSSRLDLQFQKINQPTHHVKEESLDNIFCSIDDQTAFWPWLEQQNFN